ncbi:hypothetical protein MK805_07470 [Shimazuella sp. AN120528]|uniref:hypothetical protein n=1 Tax=Shimazuella soli TaxID=1892854 RepID=UPI001F0DBBFE|nr:hypothetical protein [Shimazuella soli]MCH5584811.1 hypothetical protein [Shimazuella soli]
MKNKKWKRFISFVIPFLFLTGCIQGNLHVTINKDGSGIYQWKVLTNAKAQKYIRHITTLYSRKGYEAKFIREKNQVGFLATKPVKNIAKEPLNKEINAAIPTELIPSGGQSKTVLSTNTNPQSFQPIKELSIKSGFWKTTLLYQTQVNMQKNIVNLLGPFAPYLSGLLDRIKFRFLLTLPIAPTKQNANTVSKDGKTLTWNLKLGQNNPIVLGIDVPTPIILLLSATNNLTQYVPDFWTLTLEWILLILACLVIIIYLIRSLLRKRKPT